MYVCIILHPSRLYVFDYSYQLLLMYTRLALFDFPGLSNPTLVSVSNTVSFENYNEPLQGHLALTGDPTEMM